MFELEPTQAACIEMIDHDYLQPDSRSTFDHKVCKEYGPNCEKIPLIDFLYSHIKRL